MTVHLVTALGVRVPEAVARGFSHVASGTSYLGDQGVGRQFGRSLLDGPANPALSPEGRACSQRYAGRQPKGSLGHESSVPPIRVVLLVRTCAKAPHASSGAGPDSKYLDHRIGECSIGQARSRVDGCAHGLGRLEHCAYPVHLGGRLSDDAMGFDDQGHCLSAEVLRHHLETPHLTSKAAHGNQQADNCQNTGAGGNNDSDLTSGHDLVSLEGPPSGFGGRSLWWTARRTASCAGGSSRLPFWTSHTVIGSRISGISTIASRTRSSRTRSSRTRSSRIAAPFPKSFGHHCLVPSVARLVVPVVPASSSGRYCWSTKASGSVVGVDVALAVPDGPPRSGSGQSRRWAGHVAPRALAHVSLGPPEGHGDPVRLRGAGQVDHGLGQVELGLGKPHELDGPGGGIGHHQGQRDRPPRCPRWPG